VSDIDTGVADSLKMLDPRRPIREADIQSARRVYMAIPAANSLRTPSSRSRASPRSRGIASSSLTMSFRGTLRPTNERDLGIEIDQLFT